MLSVPARAFDVFDCAGCGQRLRFLATGLVSDEQFRACQRRCDWTRVIVPESARRA